MSLFGRRSSKPQDDESQGLIGRQIKVNVKTPEGRIIPFTLGQNVSFATIYERLSRDLDIEPNNIKLTYGYSPLSPSSKISQLGIKDGDTIQMMTTGQTIAIKPFQVQGKLNRELQNLENQRTTLRPEYIEEPPEIVQLKRSYGNDRQVREFDVFFNQKISEDIEKHNFVAAFGDYAYWNFHRQLDAGGFTAYLAKYAQDLKLRGTLLESVTPMTTGRVLSTIAIAGIASSIILFGPTSDLSTLLTTATGTVVGANIVGQVANLATLKGIGLGVVAWFTSAAESVAQSVVGSTITSTAASAAVSAAQGTWNLVTKFLSHIIPGAAATFKAPVSNITVQQIVDEKEKIIRQEGKNPAEIIEKRHIDHDIQIKLRLTQKPTIDDLFAVQGQTYENQIIQVWPSSTQNTELNTLYSGKINLSPEIENGDYGLYYFPSNIYKLSGFTALGGDSDFTSGSAGSIATFRDSTTNRIIGQYFKLFDGMDMWLGMQPPDRISYKSGAQRKSDPYPLNRSVVFYVGPQSFVVRGVQDERGGGQKWTINNEDVGIVQSDGYYYNIDNILRTRYTPDVYDKVGSIFGISFQSNIANFAQMEDFYLKTHSRPGASWLRLRKPFKENEDKGPFNLVVKGADVPITFTLKADKIHRTTTVKTGDKGRENVSKKTVDEIFNVFDRTIQFMDAYNAVTPTVAAERNFFSQLRGGPKTYNSVGGINLDDYVKSIERMRNEWIAQKSSATTGSLSDRFFAKSQKSTVFAQRLAPIVRDLTRAVHNRVLGQPPFAGFVAERTIPIAGSPVLLSEITNRSNKIREDAEVLFNKAQRISSVSGGISDDLSRIKEAYETILKLKTNVGRQKLLATTLIGLVNDEPARHTTQGQHPGIKFAGEDVAFTDFGPVNKRLTQEEVKILHERINTIEQRFSRDGDAFLRLFADTSGNFLPGKFDPSNPSATSAQEVSDALSRIQEIIKLSSDINQSGNDLNLMAQQIHNNVNDIAFTIATPPPFDNISNRWPFDSYNNYVGRGGGKNWDDDWNPTTVLSNVPLPVLGTSPSFDLWKQVAGRNTLAYSPADMGRNLQELGQKVDEESTKIANTLRAFGTIETPTPNTNARGLAWVSSEYQFGAGGPEGAGVGASAYGRPIDSQNLVGVQVAFKSEGVLALEYLISQVKWRVNRAKWVNKNQQLVFDSVSAFVDDELNTNNLELIQKGIRLLIRTAAKDKDIFVQENWVQDFASGLSKTTMRDKILKLIKLLGSEEAVSAFENDLLSPDVRSYKAGELLYRELIDPLRGKITIGLRRRFIRDNQYGKNAQSVLLNFVNDPQTSQPRLEKGISDLIRLFDPSGLSKLVRVAFNAFQILKNFENRVLANQKESAVQQLLEELRTGGVGVDEDLAKVGLRPDEAERKLMELIYKTNGQIGQNAKTSYLRSRAQPAQIYIVDYWDAFYRTDPTKVRKTLYKLMKIFPKFTPIYDEIWTRLLVDAGEAKQQYPGLNEGVRHFISTLVGEKVEMASHVRRYNERTYIKPDIVEGRPGDEPGLSQEERARKEREKSESLTGKSQSQRDAAMSELDTMIKRAEDYVLGKIDEFKREFNRLDARDLGSVSVNSKVRDAQRSIKRILDGQERPIYKKLNDYFKTNRIFKNERNDYRRRWEDFRRDVQQQIMDYAKEYALKEKQERDYKKQMDKYGITPGTKRGPLGGLLDRLTGKPTYSAKDYQGFINKGVPPDMAAQAMKAGIRPGQVKDSRSLSQILKGQTAGPYLPPSIPGMPAQTSLSDLRTQAQQPKFITSRDPITGQPMTQALAAFDMRTPADYARFRQAITTLDISKIQAFMAKMASIIATLPAYQAALILDQMQRRVLNELDKHCLKQGWLLYDEASNMCV